MMNPKTAPQSQPQRVLDPPCSTGKLATMPTHGPSQDKIRERAYKLYENRGREHGQDKQDWFRAEQELLNRG
jgi:hypothetical protein